MKSETIEKGSGFLLKKYADQEQRIFVISAFS